MDDDVPYLLLTPGPLTTTRTVREAMLRDYSTWDDDYNSLVNDVRRQRVTGFFKRVQADLHRYPLHGDR